MGTTAAYPDGIDIDAEDSVWVASPMSHRFLRVVEGGKVTATIETPGRHAIACALGGADRNSLFMLTTTAIGHRAESQAALSAAIEVTRISTIQDG